jgi:hypothetical protein
MATPVIIGYATPTVINSNRVVFSASNYTTAPQAGDFLILAGVSNDFGNGNAGITLPFSWTTGSFTPISGTPYQQFAYRTRTATGTSADDVTIDAYAPGNGFGLPAAVIVVIRNSSSFTLGSLKYNGTTAPGFPPGASLTIPAQGSASDLEIILQGSGIDTGGASVTTTPSGFSLVAQHTNTDPANVTYSETITVWSKNLSAPGASVALIPTTHAGINDWQAGVAITLTAPPPIAYNLIVSPR